MSTNEYPRDCEFVFSRKPVSHSLSTGEMNIHYLEWEGGGGCTVVLLHGIGDNATIWRSRRQHRFPVTCGSSPSISVATDTVIDRLPRLYL